MDVSSRGAFQPGAYFAGVSAASKAFVLSFSEALWAEYRKRGIDVLALCPGPVDTNFFKVVGRERRGLEAKASPESIVAVALKALEQRKKPCYSRMAHMAIVTDHEPFTPACFRRTDA